MQAILLDEDWMDDLIFDDEDGLYLAHIGTPHEGNVPHSGRFPYGSGEHAFQRAYEFKDKYNQYKHQGMSEKEMARNLGVVNRYGEPDVRRMRARYSNATNAVRSYERALAAKLYEETGGNASEVARRMGKSESTIRSFLDETRTERANLNQKTANIIQDYVDKHKYVDISEGTNIYLGVSNSVLDNAVAALEEKGYQKQTLYIDQLGTNHKTTMNVLTSPDVDYSELSEHKYDVRFIGQDSRVVDNAGDISEIGLRHPSIVSSDRVAIRYNEEGGAEHDGLIELRPGVSDLSLGGARYAQVRINVDDTHYLKGMAVYNPDLPDGVDIRFNTSKHLGTEPGKVFKAMKKVDENDPNSPIDWSNPFGSSVTQLDNDDGKLSACNVVRRDNEWSEWDKNLASQFLSKQPVPLAERQLKLAVDDKRQDFEDIAALTNPEVKKKLLLDFSEKCDAAAVDLKAAPFAGQQTHVILPFSDIKDNEIFAPNYADGTMVACIRYPHQGKFEIPILRVNNTGKAVDIIGKNAPDAVGISAATAHRLSGADYDGDTVVVIPLSDKVRVQNMPLLKGLDDFEPKERYPYYEGMRVMTEHEKQLEMGKVSNLITDMTIKGASSDEIARATRHALVVIDAEKHKLDWKASEKIENIQELKDKYQDGGGASTIISKAGSEERVDIRKDWFPSSTSIGPNGEKIYSSALYKKNGEKNPASWSLTGTLKGVPLKDGRRVDIREERKNGEKTGRLYFTETDPDTGKKVRKYVERNELAGDLDTLKAERSVYLNRDKDGNMYYLKTDPKTGNKDRVYISEDELKGGVKEVPRATKTTKMALAKDAYTLTSGGSRENVKYPIEQVYAEYANNMKALGNLARKEYISTPTYKRDPEATKKYAAEVESLNNKLLKAKAHAPLERQAQLLGGRHVAMAKEANPNMSKDHLAKVKGRMIENARKVLQDDQKRYKIIFTDRETEAIKANAISASKLRELMNHADPDSLREQFTPRSQRVITPAMESLASSMANSGYTTAQISERLGISPSSVQRILK